MEWEPKSNSVFFLEKLKGKLSNQKEVISVGGPVLHLHLTQQLGPVKKFLNNPSVDKGSTDPSSSPKETNNNSSCQVNTREEKRKLKSVGFRDQTPDFFRLVTCQRLISDAISCSARLNEPTVTWPKTLEKPNFLKFKRNGPRWVQKKSDFLNEHILDFSSFCSKETYYDFIVTTSFTMTMFFYRLEHSQNKFGNLGQDREWLWDDLSQRVCKSGSIRIGCFSSISNIHAFSKSSCIIANLECLAQLAANEDCSTIRSQRNEQNKIAYSL